MTNIYETTIIVKPDLANDQMKNLTSSIDQFFTENSTDLTGIKTSYDNKGQTFNLAFGHRPTGSVISAPMV